jgi:hydroxymethylbilane synthase
VKKRSKIIIGTRGSALALWQSHWVEKELSKRNPFVQVETVVIKTKGDKILDAPLSKIGDKGLFTKELDNALLDKRIDLAVHSFKDVPTKVPEGLMISAICEREDIRDVFVSNPKKKYPRFSDVPPNGTIATGSLRRKCQLLNARPNLQIVEIRGNLETRIRMLSESDWDGMLLAKAGVTRLGRSEIISEVLPLSLILPAVGQGALAIETRQNDQFLAQLLRPLDHLPTRQATLGERGLLRHLEGGCQIPIGAYGRIENGVFRLDAIVGSIDGKRIIASAIEGSPTESEQLGSALAERLLLQGADSILSEIRMMIV